MPFPTIVKEMQSSVNTRYLRTSLTILLIILSSARILSAQQPAQCTTKLSNLPAASELKGFRLGMTIDQVKARVPQVLIRPPDTLGVIKTTINPFHDPRIDTSTFEGVRTVSLDFLDGVLTSLWIGYDSSPKWPAVENFVQGVSKSLQLPNAWTSSKSHGLQLKCADFQMTVTMVARGPSFRIQDLTAEELLLSRREAQAEQESTQEESNPEKEVVFGDKSSKTYYSKDCQPTETISEENLVFFKTREEAEKAGFKLPKVCS